MWVPTLFSPAFSSPLTASAASGAIKWHQQLALGLRTADSKTLSQPLGAFYTPEVHSPSQSQWHRHLHPVPPMHLHLIPPMHLHLVPPMHMYSPLNCQSLRYQSWVVGTTTPNSIPSIGVGVSTRTSLNGWESLNSRTSTKAKLSRAALFSILMSKVSGSQKFGSVKTTYGSTTIAAVIARTPESSTSRMKKVRPLPL